jgi:hypothetical protein
MSDFPTALTNAVDGVPGVGTPILAKHLNDLEAKVGVDKSTVPTSLDFLIKSAGGWIPVTDTWTYASADTPNFTFTIPGDQTGLLSPGMRIRLTQTTVKYFIITAVSYGSPNTTVTVYGGTDYTLTSAAITSPYFSMVKAPFGFPLDPSKWTVKVIDGNFLEQDDPTTGTWYNLGSITISVPIGAWNLVYEVAAQIYGNVNIVELVALFTLSTTNNGESDSEFTSILYTNGYATGVQLALIQNARRRKTINVASKTPYYLNMKSVADGAAAIYFVGNFSPTIITAICAYL